MSAGPHFQRPGLLATGQGEEAKRLPEPGQDARHTRPGASLGADLRAGGRALGRGLHPESGSLAGGWALF